MGEEKIKEVKTKLELETEALTSLLKTVAKLKESGLLDLLETVAEKYEELLLYTSSDQRVYHALAALEAVLNGFKTADPWKYKLALETMTGCLMEAMDREGVKEVKPVKGLLGLLRALSDPNVAMGLGLLIYIAGRLGACIARMQKEQA